jgi:NTE family protein
VDREDLTISGRTDDDTLKPINLALQGGGAHGAFIWGVLDRLMEDECIAIDGISATSAGAMNGAILIHGLQLGGQAGARGLLRQFWRRVADCAQMSLIQPTLLDRLAGNHNLEQFAGLSGLRPDDSHDVALSAESLRLQSFARHPSGTN